MGHGGEAELAKLLGPAGAQRDLAVALVVARAVRPASKLATTSWWTSTTIAADLGVAEASTDDVYAAMDWLVERQDGIEAALARRHLQAGGGCFMTCRARGWRDALPPRGARLLP